MNFKKVFSVDKFTLIVGNPPYNKKINKANNKM